MAVLSFITVNHTLCVGRGTQQTQPRSLIRTKETNPLAAFIAFDHSRLITPSNLPTIMRPGERGNYCEDVGT